MATLLYCVAKRDAPVIEALTGVGGDAVARSEMSKLSVFTSSSPDSTGWLRPQLQTSALEFHHVLREIFKVTTIIPFRFPTIFETDEQLIQRLQERSAEYAGLLEKFSGLVQMEMRLTSSDPKEPARSGTQYLKKLQETMRSIETLAKTLRTSSAPVWRDWRARPSKEGVRAFALVERSRTAEFENLMARATIPHGFSVRVSGPWPATEFMEPS